MKKKTMNKVFTTMFIVFLGVVHKKIRVPRAHTVNSTYKCLTLIKKGCLLLKRDRR